MTQDARAGALAHKVRGCCVVYALDESKGIPEAERRHLPECQRAIDILTSALLSARAEEREACAKVAETVGTDYDAPVIASAIRARAEKVEQ